MNTYIYIGRDGEQGAELRKTIRDQHIAHLTALDENQRVVFGGPLRDEASLPCGSVIILTAESLEAARAIAESDPYFTQGVFKTIDVFETLTVFPKSAD